MGFGGSREGGGSGKRGRARPRAKGGWQALVDTTRAVGEAVEAADRVVQTATTAVTDPRVRVGLLLKAAAGQARKAGLSARTFRDLADAAWDDRE